MMAGDAHLLIVDDDERIRGLLQKFLIRNGFLVSAARDAAHADRILSGLDFDMVVLDLSLIHISEPTRHICLSRMPASA